MGSKSLAKMLKIMSNFLHLIAGQQGPECFDHGECMDSLLLDFFHGQGCAGLPGEVPAGH